MLADCHTHLDQYPYGEIDPILQRAHLAGVGLILVAGTTLESSRTCVSLAERHPNLLACVGIHPLDVTAPLNESDYAVLRDLASSHRVASISEIGLDFSSNDSDLAAQFQAFREQIRLARELQLPIVFHSREIPGQPELQRVALRVIREERAWEVGGVMHYFQGDELTAMECIDLGFYVSMAKPLLREPSLKKVAQQLPLNKMVLETDSYPQPFKKDRNRWTEPRDVLEIAQELANLKGVDLLEIETATFNNTVELLTKNSGAQHHNELKSTIANICRASSCSDVDKDSGSK